jgi:PAS domain S-box-containing protein
MATNESILKLSGLSLVSIKEDATIISADSGAITILDLDGIYNSVDEIEGKKLNNILGLKTNQQLSDFISALENVSNRELTTKDFGIRTLRGNDKKVQLSFLKVSSDGETSIKVLVKDLTADYLNEKNMLAINLMYKTIISIAPIGIVLVDKNGTIKEFNNYLVNMFGAKSNIEYLNKNIFSFANMKEVGFLDEIDFVLKNNQPSAGEKKYIAEYGKVVYFSYMLVPVPSAIQEKEINVFGIIEDISKARGPIDKTTR